MGRILAVLLCALVYLAVDAARERPGERATWVIDGIHCSGAKGNCRNYAVCVDPASDRTKEVSITREQAYGTEALDYADALDSGDPCPVAAAGR